MRGTLHDHGRIQKNHPQNGELLGDIMYEASFYKPNGRDKGGLRVEVYFIVPRVVGSETVINPLAGVLDSWLVRKVHSDSPKSLAIKMSREKVIHRKFDGVNPHQSQTVEVCRGKYPSSL
jgi:hypothetical protein